MPEKENKSSIDIDLSKQRRTHDKRLQELNHPPSPDVESAKRNEKDGGVSLWLPSGDFEMGYEEGRENEQLAHNISLSAFYMDIYPVTNAQYAKFLQETGHRVPQSTVWDEGEEWNIWTDKLPPADYENHPVVGVSWEDAQEYCRWAGKRLPSEAEWEKAARGMDERIYPWGNEKPDKKRASYDGMTTAEIGSKEAGQSPYGISDMAGNVCEWVNDWYDSDYYLECPSVNPEGPDEGIFRVVRGGSWNNKPIALRASKRFLRLPSIRHNSVGFRCALDAGS
jgi:formylglycine-generating enzyme